MSDNWVFKFKVVDLVKKRRHLKGSYILCNIEVEAPAGLANCVAMYIMQEINRINFERGKFQDIVNIGSHSTL
jgi:hypothetical protein